LTTAGIFLNFQASEFFVFGALLCFHCVTTLLFLLL
jgi:hypothetical protein